MNYYRHSMETITIHLILVRRMEVMCGSESFTPAGTSCQKELGTMGL